jgi:hypothetical protein
MTQNETAGIGGAENGEVRYFGLVTLRARALESRAWLARAASNGANQPGHLRKERR